MMKKTICLILALVMAFSLCACGSNGGGTSGASQTTSVSNGDAEVLTEVTLPLTDEKKELSVWLIWSNEKVADPNDLEGVQYIEELTNVHIN